MDIERQVKIYDIDRKIDSIGKYVFEKKIQMSKGAQIDTKLYK